jgi:polyphosphate kinase
MTFKESINIDKSEEELESIKNKFTSKLDKWKEKLSKNISNINNLEEEQIIKEFNKSFSEDIVNFFNLSAFIKKINQLLSLKQIENKEDLDVEFNEYYSSFNQRIKTFQGPISNHFDEYEGEGSVLPRSIYEKEKYMLQVELLKLQEWVVENNKKIAIVFEGRDAAGKGSTIKRFTEYLNPRHFKVIALGIPSEEEKNDWFGRYEKYLPKEGEIIFFDRSWYNRAVVEPTMGYCTEQQYKDFMSNVNDWEKNLVDSGVILIKFWFSITKEKQLQRFDLRKKSPLKYWKFSPNDEKVVNKWDVITFYKNQMFSSTSTSSAPWVIINSNDKKVGRLNAMRYVLDQIDYDNKDNQMTQYYPEVVNVLN